MALIDHSIVERLIATQLNSALPSTILALFRGDPEPTPDATANGGDNIDRWSRLLQVRQMPIPRQRNNSGVSGAEPDHAEIVVTVQVEVSMEALAASNLSITRVATEVSLALSEQTLSDASTTHTVDLYRAEITIDPEADEQKQIATGAVIVTGTACRQSGATVESH